MKRLMETKKEKKSMSSDDEADEEKCGECDKIVQYDCGYPECSLGFCSNCGSQCSYCKRILCFSCSSEKEGARLSTCISCPNQQCQDCPFENKFPDFYSDENDNLIDNTKDSHCSTCIEKSPNWFLVELCTKCCNPVPPDNINESYEGSGNPTQRYLALKCYECEVLACDNCYPSLFCEEDLAETSEILCKGCSKQ